MSLNLLSLIRVHITLLEFFFQLLYIGSVLKVATLVLKCTVHILCHGLVETVKPPTARMLQFRSLAYT